MGDGEKCDSKTSALKQKKLVRLEQKADETPHAEASAEFTAWE